MYQIEPVSHSQRGGRRVVVWGVIAFLALVIPAGCGNDDDTASDTAKTTVATDSPTTTTTTTKAPEVVVTAVDYKFEGLPDTVEVGTRLVLKNSSTKELHELVALRIPDTEKRPVAELVALTEAEQNAVFGEGPPAMVLLHTPGEGEMIPAVGDGTFSEPGRYAIICAIPIGVDPAEYMTAAQAASDGPPQIEGAGPPHFTQGMYAEVLVK